MARVIERIPFENSHVERVELLDKLLTAGEVAKILNVSAAWVYDHAGRKRPLIPSVRLGKAVRFREADLREFIEKMTSRAA